MLDGHNFSQAAAELEKYEPAADSNSILVSLDTAKTVLVPAHLCEHEVGEDYLRFNGMPLSDGEQAVVSDTKDDMAAVMAVDSGVAGMIIGRFGGKVSLTSPLLEIARGRKRDVNIFITRENAYITVWEKGLRMAEVLPDNSVDSLLYYMQVIGRRFKLRRFTINLTGADTMEAGSVLKQYFGKVRTSERCGL